MLFITETPILQEVISQNLLSKENITLCLSIFGSIGTIATWIYSYIKNRKKFSFESNGFLSTNKGLILHTQFVNHSRLSIAITAISIKLRGQDYFCGRIPEKVLEHTRRKGQTIVSHKEYFSLDFPINLASLCGTSGYLYFPFDEENPPELPSKTTVTIYTNRGRTSEKTLLLQNPLY